MADLELRKISKSFRGVRALVEADFAANRGEVHALLGENGAGKSTLIKVLSGALHADSGEIFLFGKALKLRGPADALKAGIVTVYQELSLIPDLTVAQNIFLNRSDVLRAGTYSPRDLAMRTSELFKRTGVADINPEARMSDISLAKRQMIEILKAVSKDPRVIILDEATSALSENRVEWLLDLAKKLAQAGAIVIFISHRMAEIRHGCDKITVFRNGQNVGERTVEGTEMDEIISLMLGRRIAGYFPERSPTQRAEIVLETAGLCVGHELVGVDLRVHAGEVVGVGGLAGQGQMPLFMSLFGIVRAEGEIRVHGKKTRIHSPHQSMQQGIALIPEDRATQGLILPFPIDFNISLTMLRRLRQGLLLDRKKEGAIVDGFMKQFEIKAAGPSTLVMNLSGGNQQKVVLAKYLASDPQILLMYDITRGVDVGTKKEIFKLIRDLASQGKGILFYSTDMDELINVCDVVLVMHDGKIGARLEGSGLTKENIMIASIGGPVALTPAAEAGA